MQSFRFFSLVPFSVVLASHPQEEVWLGDPNILGLKCILDVGLSTGEILIWHSGLAGSGCTCPEKEVWPSGTPCSFHNYVV